MPTMPLNQIAFLSEWPAFRTVKRDAARHHRRVKKSSGFRSRNRSRGGFPRRRKLHFESLPGWSTILLLLLVSSNHAVLDVFRAVWRRIHEFFGHAETPTFILQLRCGLGTVPWNDPSSLQPLSARSTCHCFLRYWRQSRLLQHSKRVRRSCCWLANPRRV